MSGQAKASTYPQPEGTLGDAMTTYGNKLLDFDNRYRYILYYGTYSNSVYLYRHLFSSVGSAVGPYALCLDPVTEICPNLDPDPGLKLVPDLSRFTWVPVLVHYKC